jgi:23S rRNA pseudouridine2605 synthase
VTIDGVRYGAIEAVLDRVQSSNVWITFAIREGKNREVRNVLGHLGLTVSRLIRISFGPFQLADLAAGALEEVKTRVLQDQLGEKITAAANADFTAPVATSVTAESGSPRKPRMYAGPRERTEDREPRRAKPAQPEAPPPQPKRPERTRAPRRAFDRQKKR